jgi:hypothetical protein
MYTSPTLLFCEPVPGSTAQDSADKIERSLQVSSPRERQITAFHASDVRYRVDGTDTCQNTDPACRPRSCFRPI